MNKRMNFMFTIAAVAVMGGALFWSTFTAQLHATAFDVKSDVDALQKIRDMGGLELVMPAAFAATVNMKFMRLFIVIKWSKRELI